MTNLYYIRAKVTIRVEGISGPFEQVVPWLVHATDKENARVKYETKVGQDYSHMQFSTIKFEYVEFTGEIK